MKLCEVVNYINHGVANDCICWFVFAIKEVDLYMYVPGYNGL